METAASFSEKDGKMRWYRELYLGPTASRHIHGIREKAVEGRIMAGVYYITPSSAGEGLLDIYHNGMLKQPLFSHLQCTDIVGVAYGKPEAAELVRVIIEDIYRKTGGLDVRNYFKDQDFGEY